MLSKETAKRGLPLSSGRLLVLVPARGHSPSQYVTIGRKGCKLLKPVSVPLGKRSELSGLFGPPEAIEIWKSVSYISFNRT